MNTIKNEWQAMLNRGIIPCIEYQTSSNDWLLVNIELSDNGLEFSFDSDNKPVSFDGEIVTLNDNCYLLPIDPDFSLDHHLETISNNMVEGYLLPNDLFYCED